MILLTTRYYRANVKVSRTREWLIPVIYMAGFKRFVCVKRSDFWQPVERHQVDVDGCTVAESEDKDQQVPMM